jgi:hypothetical protein
MRESDCRRTEKLYMLTMSGHTKTTLVFRFAHVSSGCDTSWTTL